MKVRALRKVAASQIMVFRIRNRKGYAAICLGNLTEGRSPAQAVSRLKHPLRRMGYALPSQFARPA
jgi:hypothetical protein